MTDHDPEKVIEAAERQTETIREQYLPAAEWFLSNPGMGPREEVVGDLAAHLGVDRETANVVVGHLVSDEADPVQQVVQPKGETFVGVIDHAEHEWFYAYDRYDDVDGRERRAVCAHCVHEEWAAADVAHFTRSPEEYDVEQARTALGLHYQVDHEGRSLPAVLAEDLDVDPGAFADRHGLAGVGTLSLRDVTRRLDEDSALSAGLADTGDHLSVPEVDVEPGASLATGTTIAGNVSWHAGNDGAGSGLNADTLQNNAPADLWRTINRTRKGSANTTDKWQTSTTLSSPNTGFKTITLTPTTTTPAGFFSASTSTLGATSLSFQSVRRNGSADPAYNRDDLVTGLKTEDTFEFRFYVYGSGTSKAYLIGNVYLAETKYPAR